MNKKYFVIEVKGNLRTDKGRLEFAKNRERIYAALGDIPCKEVWLTKEQVKAMK